MPLVEATPNPQNVESFDQLDQLLKVTSSRSWLALGTLTFLLIAALVFSIVVWIPTEVEGKGIFLGMRGGLRQVYSRGTGRLIELKVTLGSEVEEGQIVAVLELEDLKDEIADAKAQLAQLRQQELKFQILDQAEAKRQEIAESKVRTSILDVQKLAIQRRLLVEKMKKGDERLLKDNAVTLPDLFNTRKADDEILETLVRSEGELANLDYKGAVDTNLRVRAATTRQVNIENQEFQIKLLEDKYVRNSQIRSPRKGRVRELLKPEFALVKDGDPVLLIERPHGKEGRDLEVLLYVQASEGKKIHPADVVRVEPTTVRREEYGTIQGTVRDVTEYPESELSVLAELQHQDLVTAFLREQQSQVSIGVRVDLSIDPATGRFRWTSGKGPGFEITAGTLCRARITVDEQRLVSLIFPWLKRQVGIDHVSFEQAYPERLPSNPSRPGVNPSAGDSNRGHSPASLSDASLEPEPASNVTRRPETTP